MGDVSVGVDRNVNQNEESSHFMAKASKHLEDDASHHREANRFKGAVKTDESGSYQDANSRADK